MHDFDLVVIGSGPGGQKAAIAAAKLDRRVAIVERPDMLGGVCLNTGTIPSKTMREAVLYLTGLDQREMYGQSYRVKDEITIARPGRPHPARGQPGERRGAQPAVPQPGHRPVRHRLVHRPARGHGGRRRAASPGWSPRTPS